MSIWISTLLSVSLVCLVSLLGLVTLSLSPTRLRQAAATLVSFAVGALLGDAFIHLLPEAYAHRNASPLQPSLLILAGMLLFFTVEKLLRHRHGRLDVQHQPTPRMPELAVINVVGDAVHNFIDGLLIGASYLTSPALGISTTLAVVLHEIPQELADFSVLVHSGLSAPRALRYNLVTASTAILGAVVALMLGSAVGSLVGEIFVPITAGALVYIASADLIPELQHERSLRSLMVQAPLIALGIGVMALLTQIE